MNRQKLEALNAKQNHVAGTAYVSAEFVNSEPPQKLMRVSGHSQQGPPALYALPDILARGKFSKSHVYNLIARGQFPKPALVLGSRFTRWSAEQCDLWFADPQGWISLRTFHLPPLTHPQRLRRQH